MMEPVLDVLRKMRGVTGVRLDYVVRIDLRPKPEASDPSTAYLTIDDEMVARHPILTAAAPADPEEAEKRGPFNSNFIMDSQTVFYMFDVLFTIFGTTKAWTYSKDCRAGKYGRKLYFKLTSHYLGQKMIDHMAATMEATLRNLTYKKKEEHQVL